jgi:hypothetical protein
VISGASQKGPHLTAVEAEGSRLQGNILGTNRVFQASLENDAMRR